MKVNGLSYNGLMLYGADSVLENSEDTRAVDGIIDTNEIWHEVEEQRKYLFFGDSDIAWYVLELEEGTYHELDKPSGSVMESFSDFWEMLESALEYALN